MTPLWLYLLWQVPGWVAVGVLARVLSMLLDWPAWVPLVAVGAVIAKDAVLAPIIRRTWGPGRNGARLIGARGCAVERLAPAGYVRVRGELWRAEAEGAAVEPGGHVLVHGARGLTLLVRAEREAA